MNHHRRSPLTLVFVLLGIAAWLGADCARGDERLAGIACRSVHLGYPAPDGVAFYNEMTVDASADGTYFMACGFDMGYFGIQQLGNGKKLAIFSVWDPGDQNDPKSVAEEQRVKLLHKDEGVRVGRFGNEGTGGQSFYDFDWKIGETYRFLVTARIDPASNGKRTEYAGHLYLPEKKAWKHLVTFSTLAEGKTLRGYYSFVEDFQRDRKSTTFARRAHYGNGWVKTAEGQWIALTRARFTADGNPATNIDAGADGERFFLATGGETKNEHAKLREPVDRPPTGVSLPEFIGNRR
ncbi:MAG: hypothetical protein DCC68_10445 [Planctomycetota bacterium]|nr:MAG: hypothetical protein DCC68_10445 [Planctomycetota bacterium]